MKVSINIFHLKGRTSKFHPQTPFQKIAKLSLRKKFNVVRYLDVEIANHLYPPQSVIAALMMSVLKPTTSQLMLHFLTHYGICCQSYWMMYSGGFFFFLFPFNKGNIQSHLELFSNKRDLWFYYKPTLSNRTKAHQSNNENVFLKNHFQCKLHFYRVQTPLSYSGS